MEIQWVTTLFYSLGNSKMVIVQKPLPKIGIGNDVLLAAT